MTTINFPGQYQILSEWCWLTCASGVMHYYLDAQEAAAYTQCKLAIQEKLSSTACQQVIKGKSTDISTWVPLISDENNKPLHYHSTNGNKPGYPTVAVNRTGKATARWWEPLNDVDWMMNEMKNGHPALGHIALNHGGGHIVAFYGASTAKGKNYFNVADPWVGNEVWVNGQVSNGRWNICAKTRKKETSDAS